MHLLVDPVVLCLPEQTAEPDYIEQFFEFLSDWSQLIRVQQDVVEDQFFISETCCLALIDSQRYPEFYLMERLLASGDVPFDAITAYRACRRIIENLPYFEERASLPDLLVYCDSMSLNPDLIRRISQPIIADSLRETFGYVAYAKEVSQHPIASDLILLTHPVRDSEVLMIGVTLESNQDGECELETDLPIVETPEDLYRVKGLQKIWQDTGKAIGWAVDDLKRKRHIGRRAKLAHYLVAPEFNQSLSKCQFYTRPDLLAQCFLKISRLLMLESHRSTSVNHPLRDGRNGPPIERTISGRKWGAWRLYITGGKMGFRLHYWWSEGEYVLSKVGPHEDFTIGPIPES